MRIPQRVKQRLVAFAQPRNSTAVRNYLLIRKLIGFLGLSLPLVLLAEPLVFCAQRQPTMSHYYYTGVRDVFVGILCAQGIFLICYQGTRIWDDIASNVAGGCSILIALLPATPLKDGFPCEVPSGVPVPHQALVGALHVAVATGFFVTTTLIALLLFANRGTHGWVTWFYRGCGSVMALCLLWMLVYGTSFWPEAITVWGFGAAWLVNGIEGLKDPQDRPTPSGQAPQTRFA